MAGIFDHLKIAAELDKNRSVFRALLKDKTKEEYLWKQGTEKWCLLEIVCHLHDEEREDFLARTAHTLQTPDQPLPPIDPQGWVVSRNYIQENYNETQDKFLNEREQSVKWLRSLTSPEWDNAYLHPKFGAMTAKMFLTNWLPHDYLYIRQIIKLKFDYLKAGTVETLAYAGDW